MTAGKPKMGNQEGTMTEENQDRKENEKKETYRKGRGQ